MEPLKFLPTDRDLLRSVLEDDGSEDGADWDFYDHDSAEQDSIFCAAIRHLDDWLNEHPVNGGDGVDITLVADTDGTIDGYEFIYATRLGDGRLSLSCGFREWRDMRGESDGIEGMIDFLAATIHTINWTIVETNRWMTARAAA